MNSNLQLWRRSPPIQQLTAFPKPNPPAYCSGCHSSLTSSTCAHLSPGYVNSVFPLHHVTFLPLHLTSVCFGFVLLEILFSRYWIRFSSQNIWLSQFNFLFNHCGTWRHPMVFCLIYVVFVLTHVGLFFLSS